MAVKRPGVAPKDYTGCDCYLVQAHVRSVNDVRVKSCYIVFASQKLLRPLAPVSNSKGNTFNGGVKYTGLGKIGDFRRISPFISETMQDRPTVTMER